MSYQPLTKHFEFHIYALCKQQKIKYRKKSQALIPFYISVFDYIASFSQAADIWRFAVLGELSIQP